MARLRHDCAVRLRGSFGRSHLDTPPLVVVWRDGLHVFAGSCGVSVWSRNRQQRRSGDRSHHPQPAHRSGLVSDVALRGHCVGCLPDDAVDAVVAGQCGTAPTDFSAKFQLDMVRCLWALLAGFDPLGSQFPSRSGVGRVTAIRMPDASLAASMLRIPWAPSSAPCFASLAFVAWFGMQHTQQGLIGVSAISGLLDAGPGSGRRRIRQSQTEFCADGFVCHGDQRSSRGRQCPNSTRTSWRMAVSLRCGPGARK